MKKLNSKKLRLDANTIRALSSDQIIPAAGGMVSVGTCSGCRPSYCGDECAPTFAFKGQWCA